MRRAALLACLFACGGETPPPAPPPITTPEGGLEVPPPSSDDADAAAEPTPEQKRAQLCTGFEMDLASALAQAACEVPLEPGTKPQDTKGKLEIKVAPSSPSVAPGGKVDLVVSFVNKQAAPMTLDFVVDPTARFSVEAYDAKGEKRVDAPIGAPPSPPKNAKRPEASKASLARITLAANGTAKITVPWTAVKTKWAPERYAGTPPEMGFPRAPAGPLGKGSYKLRVVTPLTNVFEGTDKEISAPKIDFAVK